MKRTTKSFFALILAISCVLALCLNASAASNSKECNSGARHVTSTALSDNAESYYTNNTYEVLSEQTSAQLMLSLRQLMTGTHKYKSSYSDCRDKAAQTDSVGSDGKISLLYTSVLVTRANFGGDDGTWNREHVWPKSLGGFDNSGAGADLHHVRPSDAAINNKRGNLKFGNVSNGATAQGSTLVNRVSGGTYSNPYFEPLDNVKGDVARICLYVYVRYGGELSKCSNITNVFQSVDVLLEWCALDPVDEWEMSRNDVVEGIQGNRNVFIDYPEYAWLLFDKEVPGEMPSPSGKAAAPEAPENPVTPPLNPGTPSEKPDTPPSQGDKCTHDFDYWEEVGDGRVMRICRVCKDVEFALRDDVCLHSFDDWEAVGNEQKMRMCLLCGEIEFAPSDNENPAGNSRDNSDSDIVIIVTAVASFAVLGVAIGAVAYKVAVKKKKR